MEIQTCGTVKSRVEALEEKIKQEGWKIRWVEKKTAHSEAMIGKRAAIKAQDEEPKQENKYVIRVKEIVAARAKARNDKLAVQGNEVKALEEDTVALKGKVAPLITDFSRVELVVTEVEERQAHSQKIDSMDKETQTSELPQDENNALQEELTKLQASYHEVCRNKTIYQEKLKTELKEKKVLQEELMKLRADVSSRQLNGESKEDATEEKSLSSEKQKKPSVWKRFRHALGLRKPQRWKKSAAPSNST